MTRYWFKPKTYGYGATPANWKGWAATLLFMAILLVAAYLLFALQQSAGSAPGRWLITAWLVTTGVLTAGFVWLVRVKTDGQWMWRWGKVSAMK